MEQISIIDIMTKKERMKVQPEVWKCVRTCANFTNVFPDGSKDYFIGPGREPRCVKLEYWQTKSINNMWHSWCKNYKEKE